MTAPGTRRRARPTGSRAGAPRAPLPDVYRRRRRLAAVLAAALAVVALGLAARVVLYDAGLVDVERIDVVVTTETGAPVGGPGGAPLLLPEQQLRDAAGVALGGPLLAVDTGAVADRLAALPAVAAVDVRRDWPHALALRVVQRTPVAVAQTGGGPALVDATGAVFPGPLRGGLPALVVAAPGPGDPSTLAGVGVLAALPEPVRGQVVTVTAALDPAGVTGRVALALTEDREVRWGSPDRSADKAAVLGPLLSQPGRLYDVTSPDLPTITP